ncbi:uncharacterized protein CANTADRAFT_24843 [Suhomyces tanzawaensis NRRL Y-17324]|uniref:Uncharacterized protein n=1 Tax=Suhomyces tanzawaensis NRRL Y-17324 TaxID=984487 RepID=A0A1E4SRX1_9ASCO|nr:uncharacterized protein CANTADRAFT_24843 [Suhomyces tanzawaensis NRRL Y-17324]ODV82245.1 hypothetical protein CANTADRAFT_24843 [Suhomyces tanzawaensis NRRL Y-17324]
MTGIPLLTIPEAAYDPSSYSKRSSRGGKSQLVAYLIKLTNGSAIGLTVAYIIGLLILKPLLETTASRRLEVLEMFRGRLRDCYLNLVGRVSYIPIVGINKNNGDGKLYADAIVQTDDSYIDRTRIKTAQDKEEELEHSDKLKLGRLVTKITKLSEALARCHAYLTTEISHYRTTNYALKEFQNRSDLVYFNSSELFSDVKSEDTKTRKRNIAVDTKNEIRQIKGLFMSGQV